MSSRGKGSELLGRATSSREQGAVEGRHELLAAEGGVRATSGNGLGGS